MTTATAPAPTAASAHPRLLVTGVVIASLLAIGGAASTIPYLDTTPLVLVVTGFVLSAAALVGAVPAIRGHRWAWWLVAGSTALSVAASPPSFFLPGVPQEVLLPSVIANGVSLLALVLLVVGRPRRLSH